MRPRARSTRKGTRTKQTLSAIVASGNDYLVVVKRNQKTLHQQIESHIAKTTPIRDFQQTEKTRNRSTHRIIEVFLPPEEIDSQWVGVSCVIKICRYGTRGNQDYQSPTATYYVSSLAPNSSLIPQGIQQHWTIENRLHWGGADGVRVASPWRYLRRRIEHHLKMLSILKILVLI